MSYTEEFQYLWRPLEDGVYNALMDQVDSGQDATAAEANKAVRLEIATWADVTQPQQSFLVNLGRVNPSLETTFIRTLNSFVFHQERTPEPPSAAPHVFLELLLTAAGAWLGYQASALSLVKEHIGPVLAAVCGGAVFALIFAIVLRIRWKAKARSRKCDVVERYMKQLDTLKRDLAKVCGRADTGGSATQFSARHIPPGR